ncbi:LysR family transcriptional regulator [Kribbella sp. VKM Ac-2568]|uniref:LysR family transcriptional regulator n=1 Tax=Kribbella sp. VKM Ac-2568 TaxID=2512219 RepID=UPI001044C5D3|nr:LysR family transcriptional regulator [Kribbella sp. VKM Ac-2568]TCM37594.1 regulatory helix-turn-helix LysR family protein [Kribbella sp. VKM Ac-2568]
MDLTAAYGYRLDWIVSFVAVARHGGFSAAAKATFRSQSRISEHVAELEKALGVQLFDRTAHPAALTPEVRALLPHAEEILNRLGEYIPAIYSVKPVPVSGRGGSGDGGPQRMNWST